MKIRIPVVAGVVAALLLVLFVIQVVDKQSPLTQTFNRIYSEGVWGRDATGEGTSGSGSTLEITRQYRAYLQDFIKTHRVRSIVDAGCGDWSFSSTIDWGGASYLGVDIASDVIETVRKKHEKGNIRFRVGDITEELPAADLLISKDVLQHLPNALVHNFIRNNLRKGKYKWAILTNDRGRENGDEALRLAQQRQEFGVAAVIAMVAVGSGAQQRIAERILEERRKHWRAMTPFQRNVKDW